ncbi:hypothetical protein J6590_094099 [Homalodisca vitripennis]|nr:hypothetical protein J6590_094099 [Homalodisca vitripennis]
MWAAPLTPHARHDLRLPNQRHATRLPARHQPSETELQTTHEWALMLHETAL